MKLSVKTKILLLPILFFALTSPAIASDKHTEVIITDQRDKFLAFSAVSGVWVSEFKKLSEKVIGTKTKGNIGIVVTTKRIIGFSVLTNQWSSEDLKLNEKIQTSEIKIEGNVATLKTSSRVIGFSAHTGDWVEAP